MILSKEVTWSPILNSIDESIPTSVDITKLDVRYDENLVKHNDNGKDQEKTPLYEQIPNLITIEGNASSTRNVGQFLYELNNSIYFKKAKLENLKKMRIKECTHIL
ncbi:fimbrial assembly family protein [[Clostridium] sordellii ATCC 9714]|nr:fimbrial assembly family protein [[Clostridium] sordellii ATCC 9714] [Paeniclostridium sordellii ATCC 9714]